MSIEFSFFNPTFNVNLIRSIILIVAYTMLILSAKNQPQEVDSSHLLKYAGIIGISFSILLMGLPTMICSLSDINICLLYALFTGIISSLQIFVSLGIFFYLFGKKNQRLFGSSLMKSGILWMLTFLGYTLYLFLLAFTPYFLWVTSFLGEFAKLVIIIILLMIVFAIFALIFLLAHGIKRKDPYFILFGVLYIINISWLVSNSLQSFLPTPFTFVILLVILYLFYGYYFMALFNPETD